MSATEFADWQGFLRRYPRGFDWDNWVQATLTREIHKVMPHAKGYRMPPLKDFLYRAPPPIFAARERARSKKEKKTRE